MNRACYACFCAASAVRRSDGRKFVKHSGVRAALHRRLVKTGRIGPDLGQSYDLLFQRRGQADRAELAAFGRRQAAEMIQKAEEFVSAMQRILPQAT